ncbi:MAG: hypothetical protein ACD_30C00054G0003 [uncultured bacterium]|nr:MAG: hypothetical protein ACD_30C00054G0003 [uncultured bacterium]
MDESAYVYKLDIRNESEDPVLVFPREKYARASGLYWVPNLSELVN